MNKEPSPWAWLWDELKKALSPEDFERIKEGHLAEMRKYARKRLGSKTPLDAPKQRQGRPPR